MAATIRLTDSALFTLLLEGLEAYAIKHDGKKEVAIETHAQLWGKVNKNAPFTCEIKHVSVDSSAKKQRGEVQANSLALMLKKDVSAIFGKDYEHLGTFHTHPWLLGEVFDCNTKETVKNANSIRKGQLYNFSNSDHVCEIERETITVGSNQYSIALVMTIFSAMKADDRKDQQIESDLFELSLGNIKVWLKAQVYEHKTITTLTAEDKKSLDKYLLTEHKFFKKNKNKFYTLPIPIETILSTPFLESLGYSLESFGRLKIDEKRGAYTEAEEAENRWFHIR